MPLLFWTGFLLPKPLKGSGLPRESFYDVAVAQEEVLVARNVSFFSFRRLAWPARGDTQDAARLWRAGGQNGNVVSHVDGTSHGYVVDGLVAVLRDTAACAPACAAKVRAQRSAHRCALAPTVALSSDAGRAFRASGRTAAAAWVYRAEGKYGRYGWVAEVERNRTASLPQCESPAAGGCAHLTLAFALRTGPNHQVDVTYLRSYRMGGVRGWFVSAYNRTGFTLDGLEPQRSSRTSPTTETLRVASAEVTLYLQLRLCNGAAAAHEDASYCAQPGRIDKFKLLGITTC